MTAKRQLSKRSVLRRRYVSAMWLGLITFSVCLQAAELSPSEVSQLSRFERAVGLRDLPEQSRTDARGRTEEAYLQARNLFSGRGPDVARYFLTHTDHPPSNEAYFFLIEALADVDTALILIKALWAPPTVVSGPELSVGGRRWLRTREMSEIRVAIEAALVNETVNADARVVHALMEAVTRLRPKIQNQGAGDATTAATLLGRCRGAPATTALQKLAQDPDPELRRLAIQGLGRSEGTATEDLGRSRAMAVTLMQVLQSDPDARARAEAASALGRIGSGEPVSGLLEALARERHPQVVDAVLLALKQLNSLVSDPAVCGEVLGRTWDVQAARLVFECWRPSLSPEGMRDAALYGPAQRRAFALHALIEKSLVPARESFLVLPPGKAVPPPPGPSGTKAMVHMPPPEARAAPPRPPEFDDRTRDRLLHSAVEILSIPSHGLPKEGNAISDLTTLMVRVALWEIAARDMSVALKYADRISTPGARYRLGGRFGASNALSDKDTHAYRDYRRPRQAASAVLAALACAVLLVWPVTRRAGAIMITAMLGWGIASLFMTQVRELPPPPLPWMTLTAIAFMSAGVSVALMALRAPGAARVGLARAAVRTSGAMVLAAVLAFFACGYTRWNDIFPVGSEGWELIFDPIGSGLLAAVIAAGLNFLDSVLFKRLQPTPTPAI